MAARCLQLEPFLHRLHQQKLEARLLVCKQALHQHRLQSHKRKATSPRHLIRLYRLCCTCGKVP